MLSGSETTGPMRLLALFMKNRPEWIVAEQACFRQGATTVPMYDTLGPDVVEMIFARGILEGQKGWFNCVLVPLLRGWG